MINLTWRKPIATSGRFKWMLRKAYAYGGDAYVRNGSLCKVRDYVKGDAAGLADRR